MRVTLTPYHHRCENWDIDGKIEQLLMWFQELPEVNMRSTSGEAEDRILTIISYFLSPYITIMEQLERIWDLVNNFASAVGSWVERSITGLFGSSNARYLKRLETKIEAINSLEPRYEAMTDAELRAQTDEFKHRLSAGETLDDLLIESFAVCREAGRRFLSMRHYDVQLIGGMVLHSGAIAEMITGEGKTLVCNTPGLSQCARRQGRARYYSK